MKKVRSLLNLDLSLFRAAICGGVRAGADLPESPRRCPESCRSGGEYRDHAYNVLAAVVIICTAIGLAWATCCCGGRGLSVWFSACYSLPSLRGQNDNRTERGSVDKAL